MDRRIFVAFAPGRFKDGSQQTIEDSSPQIRDELMVEMGQQTQKIGAAKCAERQRPHNMRRLASLLLPRKLYRPGFGASVCAGNAAAILLGFRIVSHASRGDKDQRS